MRLEKEAEKQRKTAKGERKKQRCLGMQSIGHLLVELLGTSLTRETPSSSKRNMLAKEET